MSSFCKKIFYGVMLFCAACSASQATSGIRSETRATPSQDQAAVPFRVTNYTYEIIKAYPHDPAAFTQGLVYNQGNLYESTGLNGQSSLRKVELETGRVLKKVDVASQYFAEGLALFNNKLYQLTWITNKGFVYDLDSFGSVGNFNYADEGWGLTHDGHSLIMSDGSNRIRYLDPETFQVQRTITVQDNGTAIRQLNELEYIKGEIFANIWQTDRVARIDPQTGRVTGWLNLGGLLSPEDRTRPVDVLNGIAYDEAGDRLFITGKLWPKLFEVRLVARRDAPSR
ncbi:MAG: glutaminyl-peptide cyclotransferase [Blastocatellia bacterium]